MPPRVYVETSVISYLAARPSRDLITAARQQLTHEWWRGRRSEIEVCVSQLVLDEAGAGDPEAGGAPRIAHESNGRVGPMATNRRCSVRRMSSWEEGRAVNDERDREAPWEDSIVAEVRAARATLFAAAGYDLEKLVERLRREQALSGHPVVTFPPRVPEPTTGGAT